MISPPAAPSELLRFTGAGDLGPAIRTRRRAQSLRIDEAASLSGVSVDLLSRLENGKGSVRLDKQLAVLAKAATMCGMSPIETYERELPMQRRYLTMTASGSVGKRMRTESILVYSRN